MLMHHSCSVGASVDAPLMLGGGGVVVQIDE